MKKLILALALLTTTLTTSPATAQTGDPPEASTEAATAETDPAPTIEAPGLEAAEPAPESEAEPKQSEATGEELMADAEEVEGLVRAGKWLAGLGALLLLLVAVFRKWIFGKVAWFQTKQGGYTAAGGMFLLTVIGLSIKTGLSIDVVLAAIVASGFASGLHTAANDLKSG